MHHMYPASKGDQLCPLGFHPQVRWPTRCKRCFRDYKEHGGKRGTEDITSSSPSLNREGSIEIDKKRNWTSTQNLSSFSNSTNNGSGQETNVVVIKRRTRPVSWASEPENDDALKNNTNQHDVVVNLALPRRRHTTTLDLDSIEQSMTLKKPPVPPPRTTSKEAPDDLQLLKSDSLAERARKMQLLKQRSSVEREDSRERSVPRKSDKEQSPSIDALRLRREKETAARSRDEGNAQDVQFLIQVKNSQKPKKGKIDDSLSTTTETTDTTLTNRQESDSRDLIETLKRELEITKTRAEKAEREKSDILLRRLASIDTISNRNSGSELMKLQQKINEHKQELDDLRDDKKSLSLKVRELEQELANRPSKQIEDELKKKLMCAEQLCEELMDENEDMKKEMRNMEQEIDEMQDNFRDEQADEFTTLKKELEQTTKNCRILSFKLKKSERKIEQLESEKQQNGGDLSVRIRQLEDELNISNGVIRRLQAEAESNEKANLGKKKVPSLGSIGKSTSADGKYKRDSLIRSGSQEDPVQLLRDLQDSMEREADLREQLKFAEEEANSLRKKASRVEDENESLQLQLKKMTTKARSRKLSPSAPSRLTPEPPVEKDEGISDEEDPAELRVLLELNEQESSILRRKVEELENENGITKKQIKELQEKLEMNTKDTGSTSRFRLPSYLSKTSVDSSSNDKKIKTLEVEIASLKKKLSEKDQDLLKLQNDIKSKLTTKGSLVKTKSTDDNLDMKRQMDVIEQETLVLRNKIASLESENEKLLLENKMLTMKAARSGGGSGKEAVELLTVKESLLTVQKERDDLQSKVKKLFEDSNEKLPFRIPKKYSESLTKLQLKKMIEDLEDEVKDSRAIIARCGGEKLNKLEKEKNNALSDLSKVKEELANLKSKETNTSSASTIKISELETKLRKSNDEQLKLKTKISTLEETIKKNDLVVKQNEQKRCDLESKLKTEADRNIRLEKELELERKEVIKWEAKVTDLDSDIQILKKNAEKSKRELEKEIVLLKSKSNSTDIAPSKKLQEFKKLNDDLQINLEKEQKRNSELNAKCESLSEQHLLYKAQSEADKQKLHSEVMSVNAEFEKIQILDEKLKMEKTDHERIIKELKAKIRHLDATGLKKDSVDYENNKLKASIEEKDREYNRLKRENEMNIDLVMQARKDTEDMRRKLNDFEKINKVQNNFNDQTSGLEQEVKRLKLKLDHTELNTKSEVAATRLRYEQQMKNLQVELKSQQSQCERFKRDRDTFKQLLEGAQKTISDLKANSGRASRSSIHSSGDEDDKSKIQNLEQQISCLEDELCEARLEANKLKTELVSEKSGSEIKISEMQSKLNEYEEDRLMGSGRTKIPGLKTKLELSWQKEREDQQRLLQETSMLARDLRQTLFEVERERDKERLENKRKLDQLQRGNEEELEEGRRKISELQYDLLELRDAHAKLRTSNEKLRRERERFERERAAINNRRMEHELERRVAVLLQSVDEIVKAAPELQSSHQLKNEVGVNRLIVDRQSRATSPSPASKQMSSLVSRLAEASDDLRKYQSACDDERDRDRVRRAGMRRAASTENDPNDTSRNVQRLTRSSTHNGSLYRKSLSFDQNMQQEQRIWKQDDGSVSSMQSIDSEVGAFMDSRLSGDSTQSDLPRGHRKKKKGLMGKLRSLTKGRSIDSEGSVQGSDSDISISTDHHRNKSRDVKNRLSGLFKRGGSNSRSNSTERNSTEKFDRPVAVAVTTIENGTTPVVTPRMHRAKPPSAASLSSSQNSLSGRRARQS